MTPEAVAVPEPPAAGQRWLPQRPAGPGEDRALRLRGAALAGLLHAAALAAVLLWPDRRPPPAPPEAPGVALVWAEAVGPDGGVPPAPAAVPSPPSPEAAVPPGPPVVPSPMETPPPPMVPPLSALPPVADGAAPAVPAPPAPAPVPRSPVSDLPPPVPAAAPAAAAPADPPSTDPPPPQPPPPPRRAAPRTPSARQAPSTPPTAASPGGAGVQPPVLGVGRAEGAVAHAPVPITPPTFDYPPESRRRGEQGTVSLLLRVDTEGRVVGVEVQASSGHPALDQAAQQAARRWRFRPAVRDGRPMEGTVRVPVSFRLQG
jgi:periplasmic protein TonB